MVMGDALPGFESINHVCIYIYDLICRGLQLAMGVNGQAVTPACGSCAAGVSTSDPAQFNATLSGFGCARCFCLHLTAIAPSNLHPKPWIRAV